MSSWRYILTIGILVAGFTSCTEDFQLTEPYKDIPVIYGIINRADTAQYFRIQKAFVDENIPATQIAKIADSLYYPDPVVTLYNLSSNQQYSFTKVDGNLEGYPRENGPFATTPNYLYKLVTKTKFLNGGDQLKIELKRDENSTPVTSEISLVHDINFSIPSDNTRQLKIFYGSQIQFEWRNRSNTSIFSLKALVYIEEFNVITQQSKDKIIEIPFGSNIPGNVSNPTNFNFTKTVLPGSAFYTYFNDQLVPETGVERYINKIDFHLVGGGPEIGDYYKILNANTGITASQEIPRYTNIHEGNKPALGIFSSVVKIIKTITPEDPTVDSLQAHPLTRELNFK